MRLKMDNFNVTVQTTHEVHTDEHKLLIDALYRQDQIINAFDLFPDLSFRVVSHVVELNDDGKLYGTFHLQLVH